MAKYGSLLFCHISSILILTITLWCSATDEDRKVHVVYMGSLPMGEYSPSSHHLSILQEVGGSSFTDSLIGSYKRSFNGFAAKITDQERQKLASMKGVVSVFPSRTLQLQTTRSWDFMDFPETVNPDPPVESDVIVGVIDTGIWPESESFNDEGFGPAPKKWKGACKGGKDFTCNNKIIGARYYSSSAPGEKSARDKEGHGTHTASTAVGNKVKDVSFYGMAQGTARGGVPSARIAAYKVCHPDSGCEDADILAAFDDAIADGVDIITISMGSVIARDFNRDSIAIGAFHAMEKGILTSNSAGNNGVAASVASVAPWLLTVAASSMDRRIIDKVVLGNGRTLVGTAVNSFALNGTNFPLVYGKNATHGDELSAQVCSDKSLDSSLVKGKIVLCDFFWGQNEAYRAGALGSIMPSLFKFDDVSYVVPLPASALTLHDHDVVKSYMNSTIMPQANILRSEVIKDSAAPLVASFSSHGPNSIIPDIMKPDISAPGIDILAAYSPVVSPSISPRDKRSIKYNILSGTSMSCPHAAGAAAYVKTLFPGWSPSAIKSALMTTAWPMNAAKHSDGEFAYGSGHLNPVKAANPGLVYEAFKEDYINMLCSMGYDVEMLRHISGDNSTCPKDIRLPKDLNYPSMAVKVLANTPFKIKFHRTVTNVGLANSTYVAKVAPNSKVEIKVVPRVVSFESLNEKKSFVVTVVGGGFPAGSMASTSLVWFDGTHNVRSPIIVYTSTTTSLPYD